MNKFIFKVTILTITLFIFNASFTAYIYSAGTHSMQNKYIDHTLETLDGKKIVLSELLKQKKVVLIFWATWCPACRDEMPHIEKFYKENKNEAAVVGVSVGETRAKVAGFIEKRKISYPIALDSDSSIAKAYKVAGVPTIVAINKGGTILYYGHSMHEAEDKFKSLIGSN